ncbi:MAG TPA: Type 1 glutamine amidotransferase-like domain-containing protein, partial [Dehalococcoidia bacterium]|nr:Type 1 glutamine amidotransferase-like domain-containing protein [Dehalococcoidia bacterium]
WEQMGVAHFKRLGVDAEPLRIRDNSEADIPETAERIAAAGIVWFSGGSPAYLAQSFHQTRSWLALESANRAGAAVAGASGGLGVLNDHVPAPPPPPQANGVRPAELPPYAGPNALGLSAPLRALAHFDRMEARRPEFVERIVSNLQPGQMAVGVDEDTAVVWTEGAWRAMGHKRVVVFGSGGSRSVYGNGDRVDLLPPPLRAQPPVAK